VAIVTSCESFAQVNLADPSVPTYHASADRSGNFIVPTLTLDRARSLHIDEGFQARISGHLYAQPLYWHPNGSDQGQLLVATEDNIVYALDAATGREIWKRFLGKPVPLSSLDCGNIDPLGITGTPVIDESSSTVYLDAAIAGSAGARHLVFALSLKNGSILPGWPVDVAEVLRPNHQFFNSASQNQRGALAIANGRVYVPFGGHYGDCGYYHGWVIGISLEDPKAVVSWTTRARGGGIWAPGGITRVGQSLFAATGNTFDAFNWSDGEAVFRLPLDLKRSNDKSAFFAPADWQDLDQRDADLGGTNPVAFKLHTTRGLKSSILALGKDGKAYLLDQNDLGGIGGALAVEFVSSRPIRTSPAVYPSSDGSFVAFQGPGAHCPRSSSGNGLTVLQIPATELPAISTAWCAELRGAGSPIVTTTDGHSNPIVWIVGAEGDNRLHGFRGDTGEPLFSSEAMTGLRHFQTLIATARRLYVGADDRVYAYSF
jgi:outer membrane protein assembly factor BamB